MTTKRRSLLLVCVSVAIVVAVSAFLAIRGRHRENRLPPPPQRLAYTLPLNNEQPELVALEKRAEAEPGTLSFNALARAYYLKGKRTGKREAFEKAKAMNERSLKEQPQGNKAARALSIKLLQAEHQFEESLNKISDFDSEFPGAETAIPLKITSLIALGRAKEAEAITAKLLNEIPTSAAYVLAGNVSEEAGHPFIAVQQLLRALELEEPEEVSSAVFPRALLGRLYLRSGQLEDARRCLEAALALDADDVMTLRLMAHLEAFEGHFEKAEQHLIHAISVYGDADILTQLARVKRALGQTRQSDDLLRTAEGQFRDDLKQNHYGHRLQMAQLLLEKGEAAADREAVEIARAELGTRGHPFVSLVLARSLLKIGSAAEAKVAMEKVRESGLEHPLIELTSGDIAKTLSRGDEARTFYERAAKLHPSYRADCTYCPLF